MKPFIPIVLGTAREGRKSESAARFVFSEAKSRSEMESELIDVRDYLFAKTTPPWQEPEPRETKRWRDIAARAAGFVIVSPEYNHGYPGELKLLLDAAYDEYEGKPVAVVGVSSGGLGGARMVEQLRLVALELGLVPLRDAVYFSRIGSLFDGSGAITDESYRSRVQKLFDALLSQLQEKTS